MNRILEMQVKSANEAMGSLHLSDGYYCTKCNNKGFVYSAKNDELVAYKCDCQRTRKSLRLLAQSGLLDIIERKRFDNFIIKENWQKSLKELCLDFLKQSTYRTFFIGGQCGCGKTHLCTAMCAHYLKLGKSVRYFVWPREIKTLKSFSNDEKYDRYINEFISADILYIDDFLKQKQGCEPSGADINIAFEILNARLCDVRKITLISSELTFSKLLLLDQGTISRIAEGTGKYLLNISQDEGKNFRLRI